jgi:hypothetical protein
MEPKLNLNEILQFHNAPLAIITDEQSNVNQFLNLKFFSFFQCQNIERHLHLQLLEWKLKMNEF